MVGAERRRGRELVVEVNISGRSAGDPELLELIEQRAARDADVCPSQIIFEITETIAVSNIPRAQHFAARLADLGCRFALDDFGAGFGSFYYLKHLPFDYLKIDGEFVRHSAADTTDQLVIQAVVDIARGLGKRTVAEHVGDSGDGRAAAPHGRRPRPGLPPRRARPARRLAARGRGRADLSSRRHARTRPAGRAGRRPREGAEVAAIGPGLLVLLGVTHDDTEDQADRLADKVRALRVFPDAEGRMNEPLGDREVLCVSQFTLYGDARKGNRPSYVAAARPEHAEPLYERFCERLGAQRGVFGAQMEVELVNDGPVTLLLEL